MKKNLEWILIVFAVVAGIVSIWFYYQGSQKVAGTANTQSSKGASNGTATIPAPTQLTLPVVNVKKTIFEPISDALTRITKKPFGIYITPATSPIQPEKFTGYHTGVDFEIKAGEENVAVPVSATCDGTIIAKQYVDGYGGVIVESCTINNGAVTVLYGHQGIEVSNVKIGQNVTGGEKISELAQANSYYSGGERKHLHLGIHKGTTIDWRGYVASESELSAWIDWQKIY
jgi:murein DD-endopeptidase MepM/ murein hydrolase activator NlpD